MVSCGNLLVSVLLLCCATGNQDEVRGRQPQPFADSAVTLREPPSPSWILMEDRSSSELISPSSVLATENPISRSSDSAVAQEKSPTLSWTVRSLSEQVFPSFSEVNTGGNNPTQIFLPPSEVASSPMFAISTSGSEDTLPGGTTVMSSLDAAIFSTISRTPGGDHMTLTTVLPSLGGVGSYMEHSVVSTTFRGNSRSPGMSMAASGVGHTVSGDYLSTPSMNSVSMMISASDSSVATGMEDLVTSELTGAWPSVDTSLGHHMMSSELASPSLDFVFTASATNLEVIPHVTSSSSELVMPTSTAKSVFHSTMTDITTSYSRITHSSHTHFSSTHHPSSVYFSPTHPGNTYSSHANSSPGNADSTVNSPAKPASDSMVTMTTSISAPTMTSELPDTPTNSILYSVSMSQVSSIPVAPPTPPVAKAKLNYRLILYVVPPIAAVLLCVVVVTMVLCCKRYRRMYRYRQQLVPLTDMDGSDDSDDDSLDNRDPTFSVPSLVHSTSLVNKPVLAFDDD